MINLDRPLAYRMMPENLDEYVGQEHILGKDKMLYRLIKADRLSSIILWGPPGCGKTSLAKVIASTTKNKYYKLNAVTAGVSGLTISMSKATGDCVKFSENLSNMSGKSYSKSKIYRDDFQSKNTVQRSANFKTEREALNKAIQEKSGAESAHKTAVDNYNKATDDARKAGTSFSKLGKGVIKRRAEIATGEAELSKYDALVKERDALQTKLNDNSPLKIP